MSTWLTPPQLDDAYDAFAARVLHYTLLLLFALIACFFLFLIASLDQMIFIPVLIAVLGACYVLLHQRKLRLAGLIFTGGLWLIITLASYSINGVRNASIPTYTIVIIYAAILFRYHAVAFFTLLSTLSVMVLGLGEVVGVLPLRTIPPFLQDRALQSIALFGATGVLLYSGSRVIRANIESLRDSERALIERNEELERQIAERLRVEAELRISEVRYSLLFENIPVLAGIYKADGEIVLINEAGAQMLGGTPATLKGCNLRELLDPADGERALHDHREVLATGKPMLVEGMIVLPDGRDLHYLRHLMPLPNTTEPMVLALTTDMTEKVYAKRREQELQLAQERNAFLTEFFGTVSHDLKTPLAIMTTSLYLLERASTDQQRADRIARILEQVALMDNYIQDMLTIARLEHLPSINFTWLNLNPLIEEVSAALRPRIEDKRLVYQVDSQPDLPALRGDAEQLRRLLTNLIENAVNYTAPGGQVRVRTALADDYAALEIADSGIGIEPEALPHIFDRFFRTAQASAFVQGGTGLGLAIVKKIADVHQAKLDVRSQPGVGTTFVVQFPLSLESATEMVTV